MVITVLLASVSVLLAVDAYVEHLDNKMKYKKVTDTYDYRSTLGYEDMD